MNLFELNIYYSVISMINYEIYMKQMQILHWQKIIHLQLNLHGKYMDVILLSNHLNFHLVQKYEFFCQILQQLIYLILMEKNSIRILQFPIKMMQQHLMHFSYSISFIIFINIINKSIIIIHQISFSNHKLKPNHFLNKLQQLENFIMI